MKSVCILGGLGHIGLPLGILLASKDLNVTLLDLNLEHKELVLKGKLPFIEYDAEELLGEVLKKGNLSITNSYDSIKNKDFIIVCIGTPVDEYMSPKIKPFLNCIEQISKHSDQQSCIVIRSSIYPGLFNRVEEIFNGNGITKVSYCPERIVQGYAIRELSKLPQIVASNDLEAKKLSKELFLKITNDIIDSDIKEAELSKLFSNAWRYIQFATSNQFAMIAKDYGCSYQSIHNIMTTGYERNRDLPKAGFAAGPCLLKDTMQLFSFYGNSFFIGQAAMNINEGYPLFIVEKYLKNYNLVDLNIGILGMAFKPSVDDIRDSLSFRLKKILEARGSKVFCSDEYYKREDWFSPQKLIEMCEIIIVAVPHPEYVNIDFKNKETINVWSC